MGKEYGMTPTETMNRPAWQFWMDARIRAAGVAWENERQEEAMGQQSSAGVANEREKQDMVDEQEARAERREEQDGQPDLQDQMAAFEGDG